MPFSFVMSPVDGLFIILSGAVVVALELVSGAVVPDGALDDDGGEAGLIDELDDFESVLGGGAADFEGDGADAQMPLDLPSTRPRTGSPARARAPEHRTPAVPSFSA